MLPTLATALALAAQVWGPAPCGTPAIRYDAWDLGIVAFATADSCTIHLSPDLEADDPRLRCHAIVHEWGHLTGHAHSHNPRNVMYPRVHRIYWRCREAARIKLK